MAVTSMIEVNTSIPALTRRQGLVTGLYAAGIGWGRRWGLIGVYGTPDFNHFMHIMFTYKSSSRMQSIVVYEYANSTGDADSKLSKNKCTF